MSATSQGALVPAAALLVLVGLVFVFIFAPSLGLGHLAGSLAGVAAFGVTCRVGDRGLRMLGMSLGALSLAALLLGLYWQNGLDDLQVALTPPAFVLMLAWILDRTPSRRRDVWSLGLAGITVVLLAVQPEPAALLVVTVVAAAMMWRARVDRAQLAMALLLEIMLLAVFAMQDVGTLRRILAPRSEVRCTPLYLIAMQEGGLGGKGLEAGRLVDLNLREAAGPFALAALVEQWGVPVLFALAVLYGALLLGCTRAAHGAVSDYGRLVGAGMVLVLAMPALIHGLVVVDLLPIGSPPLPLISHQVPMLIASGMVLGAIVRREEDAT